jgi:asparagine synthase (glutamine-hydrolysing)
MCGIAGVYQSSGEPIDAETVHEMTEILSHRGPDDAGIFIDGNVGLGMRRLSIIDLTSGKQPIANEDGSIVVVFNGEIYNYRELTHHLRQHGHQFRTTSDTEVIVHLYEQYGLDCVQQLRGMFGFGIWDSRRRQLFLARDRLGIKPLYYTHADNSLVFGSEIKALLKHPAVETRLDVQGLSNFVSLKYVPAPQTMFAGIQALPPGHTLLADSRGARIKRYWDLSFAANQNGKRDEVSYAEELEFLLKESVRMHLVSDVPFGAFLSGGLDSSTIVALMSQFLQQPVRTFSVGFDGDGIPYSELPYARMVANRYETDHHEVIVRPQNLIDLSEKIIWHLDQPIADDACLANYMVSELASRYVKMVLTGEGGDELFAGYARYMGERLSPLFRHITQPGRSLVLAATDRLPRMRRPKLALYALLQQDETRRFTNWFPLFNQDMKAALLSRDLKAVLNDASADRIFAEHLRRTDATDRLSRMLYVDTKLWLPDDLLARGDKMSMAASIEARVPLLDHKLVEFAASLPPHLKIRRLTRKYLLKKVSRGWLPPEIIHRKKKGFPMPFSVWFRNAARSFVHDLLSPATVRRRGLFNATFLEKLLHDHETRVADHGSLLWSLLSVELWHRVFIDSRTRPACADWRAATVLTSGNQSKETHTS